MKSAIVATVFTYLIGARAAPVGTNVNTTSVDVSALHAVLNGTITVSGKDAKLVNGLVAALANRDAVPAARNSTATAPAAPSPAAPSPAAPSPAAPSPAAPSPATSQTSVGSQAAKILEDADKATGGLIFQDMSSEDKTKLTDLLKNSQQELIPFKSVLDEAEGATEAAEQQLTSFLKENGVTEASIKKMFDQGLISDLLGLLGGLFKKVPIAGPLASSATGKEGGLVDGVMKGPLGAVGAIGKNPTGTVGNLVGDVTGSANGAATSAAAASGLAKDPLGAVGGLLGGVTGATKGATGAADSVSGLTKNPLGAVGKLLGGVTGAAKGTAGATGATDSVSGLTKEPLGAVGNLLGDVTGAANGGANTAQSAAGASPTGTVSGLFQGPLGTVGKAGGDIANTVMGAERTAAKREEQPLIDADGLRIDVPVIAPLLAAIVEGLGVSVEASAAGAPTVSGTPKPEVEGVPVAASLAITALKRETDINVEAFNQMLVDLNISEHEFLADYADSVAELVAKLSV